MIVKVLLISLSVLALLFLVMLLRAAHRRKQLTPNPEAVALGAVTDFFDTLGIGSFAPTTAWLKLRKMVPDGFIPAILNCGHALPTVVQALIYIQLVDVNPVLLVSCISASVLGSLLGAPLVDRIPLRAVQGIVGVAMLIAAGLYVAKNMNWMPAGGNALDLSGTLFAVAVGAHLVLGALMSFGIGLYAPSLILLSILGLNPAAAFPVMMGACAFLMPVSGMRFVHSERIDLRVVLGLAIGGIPAVMLAAWFVTNLDVVTLRWGVVVVVLYAAVLLLRSAWTKLADAPATVVKP